MRRRSFRAPLILSALLLGVGLARADQVILTDGQVIEADRVEIDEEKGVVRVWRGQAAFSYPRSKVQRVVEGISKPKRKKGDASGERTGASLIRLRGPIEYLRSDLELEKLLKRALRNRPKVLVLEIASGGGRIDVARKMAQRLLAVDGPTLVAWIHADGENERGAYSAAAYLSVCCSKIYIAPGHSIGAAIAYQANPSGMPKAVSEKFSSAWRADFRAAAETNDHPLAVIRAMVDERVGLAEIEVKGKRRYVAARSLGRLTRKARKQGVKLRVLKTHLEPGRVLTLTAKEAVAVGLADDIALTLADVLQPFRIDAVGVKPLGDALGRARRAVEQGQKVFERDVKRLNKSYKAIQVEDPRAYTYIIDPETREFKDGGKEWRRRTNKCMAAIKKGLRKLERITKQREQNPDLDVDPSALDRLRGEMEGYLEKLKSERAAKKLPRG